MEMDEEKRKRLEIIAWIRDWITFGTFVISIFGFILSMVFAQSFIVTFLCTGSISFFFMVLHKRFKNRPVKPLAVALVVMLLMPTISASLYDDIVDWVIDTPNQVFGDEEPYEIKLVNPNVIPAQEITSAQCRSTPSIYFYALNSFSDNGVCRCGSTERLGRSPVGVPSCVVRTADDRPEVIVNWSDDDREDDFDEVVLSSGLCSSTPSAYFYAINSVYRNGRCDCPTGKARRRNEVGLLECFSIDYVMSATEMKRIEIEDRVRDEVYIAEPVISGNQCSNVSSPLFYALNSEVVPERPDPEGGTIPSRCTCPDRTRFDHTLDVPECSGELWLEANPDYVEEVEDNDLSQYGPFFSYHGWNCIEVDNENTCFKISDRTKTMKVFGTYRYLLGSLNIRVLDDCLPGRCDSSKTSKNIYIGMDSAKACIIGRDYKTISSDFELCGSRFTAEDIIKNAAFFAQIGVVAVAAMNIYLLAYSETAN